MSRPKLVLIDTCVWVPYFQSRDDSLKKVVDQLALDDRVVVIGPVVTELLRGFRRSAEADWVASKLRALRFVTLDWDDWKAASVLSRNMARAGRKLPLADLVIATVALRHDMVVFTTDPHFDSIRELRRFHPD